MASLRPDLTSNLSLAFASILIAFIIWLIAKSSDHIERSVEAPIHFEMLPAYADIDVDPSMVTIAFVMPASRINPLNSANCQIVIGPEALGNPKVWCGVDSPNEKTIALTNQMVELPETIDRNIKIVNFSPSHITLSGKLHTEEAAVALRTQGQVAAGYRLDGEPIAEPGHVRLLARPEALAGLPRDALGEIVIQTAPIDLTGRNRTFQAYVDLVLPEEVELAPGVKPQVSVLAAIAEETGQATIPRAEIRVQTFSRSVEAHFEPRFTSVTVEGPLSLLRQLKREDFLVTPKEAIDETPDSEAELALEAKFQEEVAQRVRETVRILGLDPNSVRVRMVSQTPLDAGPTPTPANSAPTPRMTPLPTPSPSPTPSSMLPLPASLTPMPTPRLTPLALEPRASTSPTLSLLPLEGADQAAEREFDINLFDPEPPAPRLPLAPLP
ncbi:MAG: hypothetical protein BWZ10_01082 [candidate division BRC1 bacterium ADurb.BinA364]|nr:MAG: hypothetical protein BWZ10_01082 [candidate division BRC1 bacterium ADurb.BinA364]